MPNQPNREPLTVRSCGQSPLPTPINQRAYGPAPFRGTRMSNLLAVFSGAWANARALGAEFLGFQSDVRATRNAFRESVGMPLLPAIEPERIEEKKGGKK